MDTDAILLPYCDVSGNCLLSRDEYKKTKHARPKFRKWVADLFGVPYRSKPLMALSRWIYFHNNPEADPDLSTVLSCCDYRCVRASHCVRGVLNLSPKKYAIVE
jgi:hypothetical protein